MAPIIDRFAPRRPSDVRPDRRRRARLRARAARRPITEELEGRVVLSGTWTALTHLAPDAGGINEIMLLSDGTVMGQGGGDYIPASNAWYRLTPDQTGSYANGTWSSIASMKTGRMDYPSNVLPDGRVFVAGGEYSPAGNETNLGEIYNPTTNSWTSIPNFPQPHMGDTPTQVLPNGNILVGYQSGPQTYIFNTTTNSWTQGATKLDNDASGEETWLKLPDNSILSYDISDPYHAQRYIPSQNRWVETGSVPVALSSGAVGDELGPALLLPDGRALYIGGNGNTAFYTPATNSWTAGPVVPNGLGADDAPGAMLVDGKVLFAADTPLFHGPTSIFEFDPATNTYTNVTPTPNPFTSSSFFEHMLALPSGQVLVGNDSDQMYVYTPDGSPQAAWKPTVAGITNNASGAYTLTGTLINGISQGASYGDDAEADSNYPIIRLTGSSGQVYYARTFDWSSTGVGNQGLESVQFTTPAGLPAGNYQLSVVANGIASNPVPFTMATQVNLSGAFNRSGIVPNGTSFGSNQGFDGEGWALSGNLLGASIGADGMTFRLGPANAADVVSARGQTIALPHVQSESLTFLAAGVQGNQVGQTFKVTYTDGTSATFTQSLSDWGRPQYYPGETIAVSMPYRDSYLGATQAGPWDIYAYTVNLNAAKTVASITLPNDPNVEVMAMDLSAATVQQDLSAYASAGGIAANGTVPALSGLDGQDYAYSSNLLGSGVVWDGQAFRLGAANRADAVVAYGQTIPLTKGSFSHLLLLGTGVDGNQPNQTFRVNYTDGTSATFIQSLSDWGSPQSYAGEWKAVTMPYRVTPSGSTQSGPWYLYGYSFTLNPGKVVSSITLPNDTHVRVLAIDLVSGSLPTPQAATPSAPADSAVSAALDGLAWRGVDAGELIFAASRKHGA